MNMPEQDPVLEELKQTWQAGAPQDAASAERIRHYVAKRGGLMWSYLVADFVIGGIALPVLAYLGWAAQSDIERMAMMGLASITVAAVGFGWWNWRGVLRSSASNTAEYVAISAERLRRIRLAWRIAWIVLAGEVVIFVVWIRDFLYSGSRPLSRGGELFAWGWLAGFTLAAIIGLVLFGRWLARDEARFAQMRRELERS